MTSKAKKKKKVTTANPVGRPSLYKPEYCKMLIEHMSKGFSFESFAADVNCTRSTLYEWRDQNQEFSDAFHTGNQKRLKYDESILMKCIEGKNRNGSARLLEFKLAAVHGWRAKTEVVNQNVEVSYEDYLKSLEGQK